MSSQNIHPPTDSNEGSHSDTGSFGKSKVPKVVEQFKKSESVHKRTLNKRVKLKDVKFDVEQENPDAFIKQIEQKHIKKRQSVPSFKEWRAATSMNLQKPIDNNSGAQSPNTTLTVQQQKQINRLSSPLLRKIETMRDLRSSSSPPPPTHTTLAAEANLNRRATLRREMTRKQFENWPQNYRTKAQSMTPSLGSSPRLSRSNSPNRTTETSTNSPLPPTPTSSTSDSLPSLPLSKNSSVNASLPSIPTSPITPFVSPTRSQSNITRPADTLSPGPLSSSNVEDPRKAQTPPSNVHKIQIPLPEVLDSHSLDVAIVQPADNNSIHVDNNITPAENNILNETVEPDDITQDEFEEETQESDTDDTLDHILLTPLPNLATITDIDRLQEILQAERRHHRETREKVKHQKEKVRQTKQGIRSLLGQLSGYKKAIEDEHGEIQAELDSVNVELEELVEMKENLVKQEKLYKEEITDLQQEIAQRKEEYVQELQSMTGSRRNGERETLNSMRVYIDELTNLEQVNETLNEALAQNCAALEKERDDHTDSLRLLDILRSRIKQDIGDMEEIKLTNEALLHQIKAFSHPTNPTDPPRFSLNLSRVSSFDNSVLESSIQTRESPGTTPDPSPRPSYDPHVRMSLPVGKSPRGPLDPMAKASWGNLMDAFNRDLDAPGEKGFFLVRKCSPEHPGSVRCMLIVEDNLWVGCGTGAIRIWSMQTGQMLEDLKAHADGIYDMKLVKDHVWTCAKDKSIHVFNIKKLRAGPVKKLAAGNNYSVCLVEVDGRVWSGHINGEIRVWSTNHYKVKKQISEGQTIGSFLKRGNVVWIGTEDNIVVYDYQTLKPKGTLVGHKNTVNCLASVGPYEVWSGSSDQTVRCWNPDSFECLKVLQAESKVFSLMEVRSVNLVFCGCWGKMIPVWNSNTYEIVQKLESSHKDATACFSLDKHNQVWSGSWDGTVDIWRYGVVAPKT